MEKDRKAITVRLDIPTWAALNHLAIDKNFKLSQKVVELIQEFIQNSK